MSLEQYALPSSPPMILLYRVYSYFSSASIPLFFFFPLSPFSLHGVPILVSISVYCSGLHGVPMEEIIAKTKALSWDVLSGLLKPNRGCAQQIHKASLVGRLASQKIYPPHIIHPLIHTGWRFVPDLTIEDDGPNQFLFTFFWTIKIVFLPKDHGISRVSIWFWENGIPRGLLMKWNYLWWNFGLRFMASLWDCGWSKCSTNWL